MLLGLSACFKAARCQKLWVKEEHAKASKPKYDALHSAPLPAMHIQDEAAFQEGGKAKASLLLGHRLKNLLTRLDVFSRRAVLKRRNGIRLSAPLPSENVAESGLVKLPSNSPWPDLRNQVDLFREAFPGRRCGPFFRKLEEITKRKLSYADRDLIIVASLRLIRKKNYAKTAEEFRTQLSWILQKIFSLSDELIKNIEPTIWETSRFLRRQKT